MINSRLFPRRKNESNTKDMESILNYLHLTENTSISCHTTNGYFQKRSRKKY